MGGDRAAGGGSLPAHGHSRDRGRGTQRGMPGSFLGRAKQGSEWVGVTCAGSEGTGHCLCLERLCWGVGVCAGMCVCAGIYVCVCVWVCVYVGRYVCICVCVYMHECVCVCGGVGVQVWSHIPWRVRVTVSRVSLQGPSLGFLSILFLHPSVFPCPCH